jgi:hypothetical protein
MSSHYRKKEARIYCIARAGPAAYKNLVTSNYQVCKGQLSEPEDEDVASAFLSITNFIISGALCTCAQPLDFRLLSLQTLLYQQYRSFNISKSEK